MDVTKHSPGSFCTSVLRACDLDRAAAFYESLMGWTTHRTSGDHRFFQWHGKTVASLQKIEGRKNDWVPHVSVENIEQSIVAAQKLGLALVDTIDIDGVARTATLRDSENTLFGLWLPASNQGAQLTEGVGSLWWVEVLVNNVEGARELYTRLFGWTSADTAFEPFPSYVFFMRDGNRESGILPINPHWGIAPRWNSIFAVEDCDATVDHALRLGACEEFVHTVPNAGRIGVFKDPDGAIFLVRSPVKA